MLFNSLAFLIFFPVTVWTCRITPQRLRWILLLAASYFFYMYWRPEYALLIAASTLVDYFAALGMAATASPTLKRLYLILSLSTNLGSLLFFKYFVFCCRSAKSVFGWYGVFPNFSVPEILLPVGISFYTFQSLSYTIEVYLGRLKPERHFGIFALYICFFPQLVAGPIERARRLLPQFHRPWIMDYDRLAGGLQLMVWGLFKKIVIADRLALYVDTVYNSPQEFSGLIVLVATYFFAFQIYADFSAYSDIAVGSARILGFDLMANFRQPYLACSPADFWKRWHISLSTWFRDYLYIPLGGSQVSVRRWCGNISLVFLVSGLWHGANWTFVIWGAVHGAGLLLAALGAALKQRWRPVPAAAGREEAGSWLGILATFHLVLFGWVFFRANSLSDATTILGNLFAGLPADGAALRALDLRYFYWKLILAPGWTRSEFFLAVGLIVLFLLSDLSAEKGRLVRFPYQRLGYFLRLAFYDALVFATILLGVFGQRQFIYFQF